MLTCSCTAVFNITSSPCRGSKICLGLEELWEGLQMTLTTQHTCKIAWRLCFRGLNYNTVGHYGLWGNRYFSVWISRLPVGLDLLCQRWGKIPCTVRPLSLFHRLITSPQELVLYHSRLVPSCKQKGNCLFNQPLFIWVLGEWTYNMHGRLILGTNWLRI